MTNATATQQPAAYIAKSASLRKYWEIRNTQFVEWYKRLRLDDNLKQRDMESFIANDPRTLYNLALYLLTPSHIPYNMPLEDATPAQSSAIALVEAFVRDEWVRLNRESRSKGRQDWLTYLVKLMLATGWYAVFCIATPEGLVADIWNPAETFPDLSDGLSSVSHEYTIPKPAAAKRIKDKGWKIDLGTAQGNVTVIDYWEYNDQGVPENTILMNGKFAKPPTAHGEFEVIPVMVSPVAGLPDNGVIEAGSEDWKKNVGEAIVATNNGVYENQNRQMTFLQQILRDTAQPRFKERSRSGNVLSPENVFKRGAIFKMDIDEDVGVIDMPSIPPELRTQMFDIQNMIQRGGFPWALYGNISGDIAAFVMGQIAAAANQVLQPYRTATSYLLTDVMNSWIAQMRNGPASTVREFNLPTELPETAQFLVDLKVQVPGDLALRATTARQLDPDFRLSETTVMDQLFPEIHDPSREVARRQRDDAMRHPIAAQLSLIAALRAESEALQQSGNTELSRLYAQVADQAEQQLATPQAQPPSGRQPTGPGSNTQPSI